MIACSAVRADWREICLYLMLATGVTVVTFTETLGAFSLLTPVWLAACWLGWAAALGFLLVRRRRLSQLIPSRPARASAVLLAVLAMIVLLVGVSAWFAPPNTVDSMNYHLSRVANWQQEHSVANYPAGYLPQLYQPPWAEFAVLNLQILSGSDRFANGVQWLSMIGSLIAISLVGKYLGLDHRGQLLTAVFAGALPVGLLEASGTQNDYVAALWLICFVACVLRILIHDGHRSLMNYVLAGAALGLAINTKGTNYFFAAPFVALLVLTRARKLSRASAMSLVAVGAIAVAINAGYYVRNYELFQSVLGPGVDEAGPSRYMVDELSLSEFASNLVRNVALHLGMPEPRIANVIFRDIQSLHERLGISKDSPLTTWKGTTFQPVWLELHESRSGNFAALVVVLVSLVAASAGGLLTRDRRMGPFVLAWAAGFLLFCALLKWQPWNSRLHLAWFLLAAPIVGAVWTRQARDPVWVGLALALLLAGLPWVLVNETRPLLGQHSVLRVPRQDQYFVNLPDLEAPYLWASRRLRAEDCRRVGILSEPGSWDYPLWVLVRDDARTVMLKNVDVPNVSARLPSPGFVPCAIVALRPVADHEVLVDGQAYERVSDPAAPTSVYQRVDLFLLK